jgi:hypothetical protein
VIDVDARPRLLMCGRATDVTLTIVNRSERPCYSVVLEIEPDRSMRLVGGDPHVEIDELRPGKPYPHLVRLTGRTAGTGQLGLANFSYLNGHGAPVRSPFRAMEFRVQPGPPPPRPEQARPAPPTVLPTAFVSHRRLESGWLAEYLSEDLPGLLRGSRIVVDVDLIRPGDDWRAVLDRELDRSTALLALIGPTWEHPTTPGGRARIEEADDMVRYEIAMALDKPLLVIPVLWGRSAPPAADTLPLELRRLPDLQVTVVDQRLRRRDLDKIAIRLQSAGFR